LGKVADVSIKSSPAVIRHEAVSRRVKIGLAVSGRDVSSVMRDVESRLESIAFPLEYHAEVRGESSATQSSRRYMIGAGIAAAVLIFLLLQAVLGGWRLAGLVWLALAAALSGGVFAASIAGDDVSLGSLLAFLALLAIAARNGVLLIDRYRRLERDEGVPFGRELVVRGARERLVPIVLTAAAIALALIPLLATGGAAGQEIANPIAVIVLGGLVTSTALTLFVLPSLYLRFGAGSARPADA
jgi:Cu/Ag efflux pump CusA